MMTPRVNAVSSSALWRSTSSVPTELANIQQLVRKRSDHTSTRVGACKRLALSFSDAQQIANARMLRSSKS
jgi:ABC-type transport system involved in Fe-S cluster assembly fused permease/ATPase subunit